MLCQSVYIFRRTSGVYPWPKSRKEVDDKIFETQICLLGGHQLMVDVSHCDHVSPQKLNLIQQCVSLCYLDLSYTKVSTIRDIVEKCTNLKSLMLAGLNSMSVDSYTHLAKATTLEILSLRGSKNVSDRAIAPIKDMIRLRSLDLGGTDVTLSGLGVAVQGLTRLEELVLDNSRNLTTSKASVEVAMEDLLHVLQGLPSLKTLNLCDSAFGWPEPAEVLMSRFPYSHLHLEKRSRRIQFCEAIMDNDTLTMRRLAGDGVDINMRLDAWFAPTLLEYWLKRCNVSANGKRIKTPCFQCEHSLEMHRPNPIALAVMFNAQGCLADLLFMGAHPFMQVWFGEVQAYNGRLVVDEDAQEARDQHHGSSFFYLQQLPQAMFDRNVHRFTDGHITAKTSNWKELGRDSQYDLEGIIKGHFHQVRKTQEERAEKLRIKLEAAAAEALRKDEIRRVQREAVEKAENDAKKKVQEEEMEARRKQREQEAKERGYDITSTKTKKPTLDAATLARKAKKAEADAEAARLAAEEEERVRKSKIVEGDADFLAMLAAQEAEDARLEQEELDKEARRVIAIAASHERAEAKATDNLVEEWIKGEVRDIAEEAIEEETPVPYKKPGRRPLLMLGENPTPFTWREHSMVWKLTSPTPISIPAHKAHNMHLVLASEAHATDVATTRNRGERGLDEEKERPKSRSASPTQGAAAAEATQRSLNDHNNALDVTFMGKRSFWLESNAFTLAAKIEQDNAARDRHERRRREDRLYNMQTVRLAKQSGQKLSEQLKPIVPLKEKRDKFHELVAYDFKRKYLVRGAIEEDGPVNAKGGEEDADAENPDLPDGYLLSDESVQSPPTSNDNSNLGSQRSSQAPSRIHSPRQLVSDNSPEKGGHLHLPDRVVAFAGSMDSLTPRKAPPPLMGRIDSVGLVEENDQRESKNNHAEAWATGGGDGEGSIASATSHPSLVSGTSSGQRSVPRATLLVPMVNDASLLNGMDDSDIAEAHKHNFYDDEGSLGTADDDTASVVSMTPRAIGVTEAADAEGTGISPEPHSVRDITSR